MEWSSEFCRKRHPTDDLNEEQPLSKRLSLLNLNFGACKYSNNARLYWLINERPIADLYVVNKLNSNMRRKQLKTQIPPINQRLPTDQERMEVDNVVYVSDLDSDSESDADDRVVFLPDVERKLNNIPYALANGDRSKNQSTSTELILYSIPSAISIPEQKDVVRRAIIESRRRLREKSAEAAWNSISPTNVSGEMFSGLSTSDLSGTSNNEPKLVFDGANSLMSGGWGSWRPLDANMVMKPSDNFEDLDAMEIE